MKPRSLKYTPLSAKGSFGFPEQKRSVSGQFFSPMEHQKTVWEINCFSGQPPHSASGTYSIKSAGWQSSTEQILSNPSMGKCFTVPRQIAEIVGGRMPVRSANSFCVISRIASITFTRNFIIIGYLISFNSDI